MRYRITIEIDTEAGRIAVNNLAIDMQEIAIQIWCNPVFVSTEVVTDMQEVQILRK